MAQLGPIVLVRCSHPGGGEEGDGRAGVTARSLRSVERPLGYKVMENLCLFRIQFLAAVFVHEK